jgi:hypothetical protein
VIFALGPLRQALLPHEILYYQATLVPYDVEGAGATFRRAQGVRFVEDGVRVIVGYAWGELSFTHSHHGRACLGESLKQRGRRPLVTDLVGEMAALEIFGEPLYRAGFVSLGSLGGPEARAPAIHMLLEDRTPSYAAEKLRERTR